MRFKKVPDELPTSLICHCPLAKENSQCRRLTTFDLKPIGASEGPEGLARGMPSRSEYLPTLMIEVSEGRVRFMGAKGREGRELCWES